MTPDTSVALRSTRANLVGFLTTAALLVLMTLSGALYLVSPAPLLRALQPLGYPAYFLRLLGVAKLLGVAALLVPARPLLKEWAYAGFTFDLLAALASHSAVHDGIAEMAGVLAVLLVLAVSYAGHLRRTALLDAGGAP